MINDDRRLVRQLVMTQHVIDRWRERKNPTATHVEIREAILSARPATRDELNPEQWVRPHSLYVMTSGMIVCLNPRGQGRYVAKTCFPATAKSEKPLPRSVRDDLLLNPRVRKSVAHHAWSIARKYGSRVDPDDLIQEAFRLLIRAAELFTVGNGTTNVWGYARRGVLDKMNRLAARQVRDSLYMDHAAPTESEPEVYGRLCAAWLDRLRGWGWVSAPADAGTGTTPLRNQPISLSEAKRIILSGANFDEVFPHVLPADHAALRAWFCGRRVCRPRSRSKSARGPRRPPANPRACRRSATTCSG